MRELYLNRRFFILLLGGVFALLAAYVCPEIFPWVMWLLCACGVLIVVDVILLFGFGRVLSAGRIVGDKFSNGEENPVKIWIDNKYPFTVNARVLDEIPVQFQRHDLSACLRISSREHKETEYSLRPVKRGEYGFGQIRIFITTGLSLIERRYSFDEKQFVMVYPSFVAMRKYELQAFTGKQVGNGKRWRTAGISTAFDQIKPYVSGDDPRTVNWKATAKCDRLMVNTYIEERSQQVYCIIDKGRTMQALFNGMTILDYAINATLALSNIILKKDDKAGLFTFSNKPGTLIKAENRATQLGRISEALYNQRTHYLESDFEQLCVKTARYIPTRSLLILFTNFDTVPGMRRRLPALIRLAKTHLLLVVLFEDSEVYRVANEPSVSVRDIYFKTIAGSFILGKKQIAYELRKAGIHVLLTQPEQLTVNAINSYLELKERGLI